MQSMYFSYKNSYKVFHDEKLWDMGVYPHVQVQYCRDDGKSEDNGC